MNSCSFLFGNTISIIFYCLFDRFKKHTLFFMFMEERLQKILAQAGIASRRKCEELITQGRVAVNGQLAIIGMKADVNKDKILVDGKPVKFEKKVYIMLNKPKGFVTTVSEKHEMKTVMSLVNVSQRVFPVGRLDKDTEGLLLFTNDGDFANKLTHPRYEVTKEYFVLLKKELSEAQFQKLEKGIVIDDKRVAIRGCEAAGREVFLSIHEGRKHIVRRIFEVLGVEIVQLVRVRIGRLGIGELKSGKWRYLTQREVDILKR